MSTTPQLFTVEAAMLKNYFKHKFTTVADMFAEQPNADNWRALQYMMLVHQQAQQLSPERAGDLAVRLPCKDWDAHVLILKGIDEAQVKKLLGD